MRNKLVLKTAIASLALAFSLGQSIAFAADDTAMLVDQNFSRFDDSANSSELLSDDIYAVLSPTARHGGGHGGPPPGGPGGPPPGGGGGWGPPPGGGGHGGGGAGGGPGGGWRRGVQCRAVNRRGIVFYGQGRNMPEARDAAWYSCQRVSRQCFMDGCQPL